MMPMPMIKTETKYAQLTLVMVTRSQAFKQDFVKNKGFFLGQNS
jgi:hypothetical protein